jgi:hypothetical protein
MIYDDGRNRSVPGDGRYTVRIHVARPRFMRHDKASGYRFVEQVPVEFPTSRSRPARTDPRRHCAASCIRPSVPMVGRSA